MKNRLLAISLILCITSLAFIGTVKAQTVTAGVSPGSVFDYHISSYWSTSDSYASIPEDLTGFNHTDHFEVRISTVNETNIGIFYAIYYNNGSQPFGTHGNINYLSGTSYGDFAAIIPANLNVGDKIHPNGDDGITIKDTTTRNYESGSRVTNHVQQSSTNSTTGITATRDLYFDKETGMLVEEVDTQADSTSTSRVTWTIVSVTDVVGWVVPEFPVVAMVPVFLLAGAFAAIVFRKKFVSASSAL